MTPERYIELLERIVAAKKYADAEAFAVKNYAALADRFSADQRERITALMAAMDAPRVLESPDVVAGVVPLGTRADTLPVTVFGEPEEKTLEQLQRCIAMPEAVAGVLCADAHYGYSQPVGGVAAYRDAVSVSGVGYDIGCGLKGVRTNLKAADIRGDLPKDRGHDRAHRLLRDRAEEPAPGGAPALRRPALDRLAVVSAAAEGDGARPTRHRGQRQPFRGPAGRTGDGRPLGLDALRLARPRAQDGDGVPQSRRRPRLRGQAALRAAWTRRRPYSRRRPRSARRTSRRCGWQASMPTRGGTS